LKHNVCTRIIKLYWGLKNNFIFKGGEKLSLDRSQLYYPCDTANAKGTNHLKILYWYVTECSVFWHENLQNK